MALSVAQERRVDGVLARIATAIAAQGGVALARVWLVQAGDLCNRCHLEAECADRSRCLHLMASAGNPTDAGARWDGLDGAFRRFPLGVRKVGKVGATGAGILLHDMSERSAWIVRPEWAAREGIRSFAAQPIVVRGDVLGVVAVFSRTRIDGEAFAWLRAVADHAAVAIANARAFERLELENRCLRAAALGADDLVGGSPALLKVRTQVGLAAASAAPVLVTGEPGTGKTLVARLVHARSDRAQRPFIGVDAGALSREHVEAAAGGTLFLDAVDALPRDRQHALLNVLESEVRVVVATTRDLPAEVAAGRFRDDLYFRLSVFPIHVPPLRDRRDDVAPLVKHFLRLAAARLGRPAPVPTRADLRLLEREPWPGNVRELAVAVERAVLVATDGRARFERCDATGGDDPVPALEWRHRERTNVAAALARAGGRIYGRGGAAELLGIPPTTLASRLKALGIVRRAGG